MEKAQNPLLAGERAALGPSGKQGGNPNLALVQGGAVDIPDSNEGLFEKKRQDALEQEKKLEQKDLVKKLSAESGPTPDEETLSLLKNLKPEEDHDSKK
jgi:hypothetical protein